MLVGHYLLILLPYHVQYLTKKEKIKATHYISIILLLTCCQHNGISSMGLGWQGQIITKPLSPSIRGGQ